MRNPLRLWITAACLLTAAIALLSSPSAQAARTDCAPESGWPAQDPNLALEVVQRVNQYRAERGLSQLTISQSLTNAASWKASQLANDVALYGNATPDSFGHTAFDHIDFLTGRQPDARVQACGYGDSFGENIALAQPTPEAVMTAWINSPGHRANLEYAAWTAIGVGAAPGGRAGTGWAQVFGVSNPDPVPTPVASLAPSPATTAPSLAVPLPAPVAPPAPAAVPAAMAAPGVRIMARPRSRTRKRTARIRWSITGAAQQVTCSLNGRALARCGTTGRTLKVRRGRQVFRVTVTGPAGRATTQVRWRVVRG